MSGPEFSGVGTVLISQIQLVAIDPGAKADTTALATMMNPLWGFLTRCLMESDAVIPMMGETMLACWGPAHQNPSHAALALACGQRILDGLPCLQPNVCATVHLRLALGIGQMTSAFIAQRLQVFGIACATAKRLAELDLPKHSSILCTNETLSHVVGMGVSAMAIAKCRRASGEEIEVFEISGESHR